MTTKEKGAPKPQPAKPEAPKKPEPKKK